MTWHWFFQLIIWALAGIGALCLGVYLALRISDLFDDYDDGPQT
jgi:hypothetical protein